MSMNSRQHFVKKFDAVTVLFPDKPAVVYANVTTQDVLTYSKLFYLSNELIASVFSCIRPSSNCDICIGLSITFRPHLIPIICSIWKSGHGVAPLNTSSVTKSSNKYICSDKKIATAHQTYRLIASFFIDNIEYFLYGNVAVKSKTIGEGCELCYSLTTSGSTGPPKIVNVPWSCILPNASDLVNILQINSSDVIFSVVPPTFDPFFIDLLCSLTTGATLLFVDQSVPHIDAFLPSLRHWNQIPTQDEPVEELQAHWKPTSDPLYASVLQITPSMLYKLFDVEKLLSQESTIQKLVLGGEVFPIIKESHLNNCKIYNIYGITEVSCWAFICEVPDCQSQRVPLGQPLADITFKIVDGELLIGSSRRCLLADETKEALPEVVYRRTGDIVEIVDGQLYFMARCDDTIKKHGHKVDLSKINTILSSCAFLKSFAVVFNLDSHLVTWFLEFFETLTTSDPKELSLDRRKQVDIVISTSLKDHEKPDCLLEMQIPLTSHGKKDFNKLRSIVSIYHRKRIFDCNKTLFKEFCCEILMVNAISNDATFLQCGGNSVLAMNLLTRLNACGATAPNSLLPYLLSDRTFNECLSLLDEATCSKFRKVDARKGGSKALRQLWNFDMKKCVDASPVIIMIKRKRCIVIGSHSHLLSAIDCQNGEEVWTTKLTDRIEAGVCSSPDEKLLVVGSYNGIIYGIESDTGTMLWTFQCGDMVKCTARLAIDGKSIFIGSYDKHLYHLSLQGNLLNSIKIGDGAILGKICVDDKNKLFVGALDGSYACLESSTLKTMWSGKLNNPIFSPPCFLSSENSVIFTEVTGVLHCFESATGFEKWQYKCNGNIFSGLTMIETDQTFCVTFGCYDSNLYLLQINTPPKLKWKRQVDSPIYGAPSFENGLIVCAETRGTIHLFALTGDILSSFKMGGEVYSSPVLYSNEIFLGCRNNQVVCLTLNEPVDAACQP